MEYGEPIISSSLFDLCSLTKQFTSLAASQLRIIFGNRMKVDIGSSTVNGKRRLALWIEPPPLPII